ncbi:MAG: AAA family ATPase [Oscillospiraceae bacterium]|nr:AAA family ATPase [Oscillospiraceae bacterium]
MKIAVSGKGGVGKSTIAAAIALTLSKRGEKVLALDADPDANLAAALGIPKSIEIRPISREIELIKERTGVEINEYGKVFKLNPEVSDIAEKFGVECGGVNLVVLGASSKGGGGCACPENTFVKSLVTDLVLYKNETLVMDMEAGIEHLGRGTAAGVDVMLIVVEPGQRSLDCAESVMKMGGEIGLDRYIVIANKINSKEDEEYIAKAISSQKIAAFMPYAQNIREADRNGVSVLDAFDENQVKIIENIILEIEKIERTKT